MAARRQSEQLKQAIALLRSLSEARQASALDYLRFLAEDDVDDDTAFLEAHPDWVAEDMACFARIEAGDYSQTVSAAELRRELGLPARKEAAHV